LRAESYFNLATEIENLDKDGMGPPIIRSYGGKSLHEQSHGESFFALFMNRFRGDGFYILDEPEAALSPSRQLAFLSRLHELVSAGSQFLIATHSPILMAYPNAEIFMLADGPPYLIDYTETEQLYRHARFPDAHRAHASAPHGCRRGGIGCGDRGPGWPYSGRNVGMSCPPTTRLP
jgi:predicted ATPase